MKLALLQSRGAACPLLWPLGTGAAEKGTLHPATLGVQQSVEGGWQHPNVNPTMPNHLIFWTGETGVSTGSSLPFPGAQQHPGRVQTRKGTGWYPHGCTSKIHPHVLVCHTWAASLWHRGLQS